jgi:fructokinase
LGSKGTYISDSINGEIVESIKVEAVDTTGAGDAFVGAFLYNLEKNKMDTKNFEILKKCVYKANQVAASVCTKMGAMEALDILNKNM